MPSNPTSKVAQPLYQGMDFESIRKCVHCGLCLEACPTYRESGLEQDSPRGRLYIMKGLYNNTVEMNEDSAQYLNRCLNCRACETACPSLVPYSELYEKTIGLVHDNLRGNSLQDKILSFVFKKILPSNHNLIWLSKLLRVYKKLSLDSLIKNSRPLQKLLPKSMIKGQYLMPEFAGKSYKQKFSGDHKTQRVSTKKGTVALFTGCVADVSDHEIHDSTMKLLDSAGYDVIIPKEQSCCGALQVHGGDRESGREQGKKNISEFRSLNVENIITTTAGCSAQMKDYHHLLDCVNYPKENEEALAFEAKVIDILEFLSRISDFYENTSWIEEPDTIIYDAPCHLLHAQKVDAGPTALLSALPGVTFVKNIESNFCCGSAGIYNMLQPELSDKILHRKIESIKTTLKKYPTVKTILTGNMGCLYQLKYGVETMGLPELRVMHPVVYMANRLR